MHEMSLCQSVLRILKEQAGLQNFTRVRKVTLEIGRMSCAVPESMELCFEAVTRGTFAEGAQLAFVRTPGEAWCERCAKLVPVTDRYDPCPECGAFGLDLKAGDGLRIKEVEVD